VKNKKDRTGKKLWRLPVEPSDYSQNFHYTPSSLETKRRRFQQKEFFPAVTLEELREILGEEQISARTLTNGGTSAAKSYRLP
jgi:hypothetical protein